MQLIFLILLINISMILNHSCTVFNHARLVQDELSPHAVYIDADFTDIYYEFLADARKWHADTHLLNRLTEITYDEVPVAEGKNEVTVGVCEMTLNYSVIHISKKASKNELKLLLYHELGHCVLGLDHTERDSNTIMQPVMIPDKEWIERNWDWLVQDLFAQQVRENSN